MNVVIIGGGIMGLSIALELQRHGLEVTVVERGVPGAEASSAAAGMLAPQLEAHGPGPMLELSLRSRGLYPAWARQLQETSGVDVAYLECGALELARDEAELTALEATLGWQRAVELRATMVDAQTLRALEPMVGPQFVGALHFPDEHQVEPARLMRALAVAATKAKVTFVTGHVRGLVKTGGRCTGVDVDGQPLGADVVVLAAGSWTALVDGAGVSAAAVKPAKGQMVELTCRAPPAHRLLKSATGYLVPRADGRVVVGSTMELVGFDKSVTADGIGGLLSMAKQVVPALGNAQVTHTWAGLRPWTTDALPLLGEATPGLVIASGHFRNGILLAPITAKLVGQLIRGDRLSMGVSAFAPDRHTLTLA